MKNSTNMGNSPSSKTSTMTIVTKTLDEILISKLIEFHDEFNAFEISRFSRVCREWHKMFLQISWNVLCFTNGKPSSEVLEFVTKPKGSYNRVWSCNDFDVVASVSNTSGMIQFNALTINVDHKFSNELFEKFVHLVPSDPSSAADQQMACPEGDEPTLVGKDAGLGLSHKMMENVSSLALESSMKSRPLELGCGAVISFLLYEFRENFFKSEAFNPKELMLFGMRLGEFPSTLEEIVKTLTKSNLRLIFIKECSAHYELESSVSRLGSSLVHTPPMRDISGEPQDMVLLVSDGDFDIPPAISLGSISSMIVRPLGQGGCGNQEDDISAHPFKNFLKSKPPIIKRLRLLGFYIDTELLGLLQNPNLESLCLDECIINERSDYTKLSNLKSFEILLHSGILISILLPPKIEHFLISYENRRVMDNFQNPNPSLIDASHCHSLERM